MRRVRTTSLTTLVVVVGLLGGTVTAEAVEPSFTGLGDLPGGDYQTRAYGISGDGTVVVGEGAGPGGYEPFMWTQETGVVGLGWLPGGDFGLARSVSADDSVIVGFGKTTGGYEVFRWTVEDGIVGLGDLSHGYPNSRTGAVSGDGRVVVGYGNGMLGTLRGTAFRWTASTGMVALGELPGGYNFSVARAVSYDGSVIAGASCSDAGREAVVFEDGPQVIGNLGGSTPCDEVYSMSADGSVMVGQAASPAGPQAYRWTAEDGMVGLGDLPGGTFDSSANDVSADGAVIVGGAWDDSGPCPMIWDEVHGMRNLQEVLVNDFGLNLTGWDLGAARGVSADGRTIVGWGDNPAGHCEAWIATIPEPASAALLLLGAVGLVARRGRSGIR